MTSRRAHLVGIAGNGMSSLAALMAEAGWRVSGSDRAAPDRWL
jgi:UDP-N-acetylmuramate-alanine ligase